MESFKPYYNWNTFNTEIDWSPVISSLVLNLIITGIPSIHELFKGGIMFTVVLNLIITGIPSIHYLRLLLRFQSLYRFKPYYNWNTFNTKLIYLYTISTVSFKPYYNWNTFNTEKLTPVKDYDYTVLNLIITGIPSIRKKKKYVKIVIVVLNLIITGIPSIL